MTLGVCPKCGTPRTGERFCTDCGEDLQPLRSLAQDILPGLGGGVAWLLSTGIIGWLTYGLLAEHNPILWIVGTFVIGMFVGGVVAIWLRMRLA